MTSRALEVTARSQFFFNFVVKLMAHTLAGPGWASL